MLAKLREKLRGWLASCVLVAAAAKPGRHWPRHRHVQNGPISTRSAAQTRAPLHRRAAGFGLRSALVDGNDVLAVYAVTAAAVASVRAGGEPAFIEALTYRMAGHSTSDDPWRYRPDAEVQAWERLDPITRLRHLLEHQGWAGDTFAADVQAEAEDLAARTRAACLALRPAPLEDAFRHTLTVESDLLCAEREQCTAGRSGCRSRSGCPVAEESERSSITASPTRPISVIRQACG